MTEDRRPPHLKVIDNAREQKSKEERKKEAYQKRASSQKAFYAQARINLIALERLKEALKTSVVIDEDGNIVVDWTDDLIEALISDIEDPGPRRDS